MKYGLSALIAIAVLFAGPVAADGDPAAGKEKSAPCTACHGQNGNSANAEWPNIAGMGEKYLYRQLRHFKSGERQNAIMAGQVANLSDQDMQDLAAYYATQTMEVGEANEEMVELGRRIYRAGDASKGLPACAACHGPAGQGNPPAAWPRLGGQNAPYVVAQLQAFKSGQRANSPNGMMADVASMLTEEEMRAVASYVSGLYPGESE